MLLIHAGFPRFGSSTVELVNDASKWVQWSVPAFFFSSGFLAPSIPVLRDAGEWIRSRAARLLVPYLAFVALYKISMFLLFHAGLVASFHWTDRAGPQLYFLPYLLAISVVGMLFAKLVRETQCGLMIGMIGAASVTAVFPPSGQTTGPEISLVGLYLSSYLAGMAISRGAEWVTVTAAEIIVCGLAAYQTGNVNLPAIAVVPALFGLLRPWARNNAARPLVWLGRQSAAIYVWHTPILMPAVSIITVRVLHSGNAACGATLLGGIVGSLLMKTVTTRYRFFRWWRI